MLQCCIRRRLSSSSSVTLCIVAKRGASFSKSYYWESIESHEKSICTKMNDFDLCLEVVSRWRQPLRYIWRWISRKRLEIEAWFQRTTNRKWHNMGYQIVTWPMTKVLWGSTVGYPSDSLASCFLGDYFFGAPWYETSDDSRSLRYSCTVLPRSEWWYKHITF